MHDTVITSGTLVNLTYSIRDSNGHVLEQSDIPVQYFFGGDQELIGGMDQALLGRKKGDVVEFKLSAQDSGFGAYDPDLTFTDDIEHVPPMFRMIGAEVPMENESGEQKIFRVIAIKDGKLTIDGNHPFAGHDLFVTIRIKELDSMSVGQML
jgi:FKBP-type peptidyl-prolyl cis-trans isomerase SlyD